MYIIYHKLGFPEPTPEEFAWFYQLKACSDEGHFYTSKWPIKALNGIYGIHDNMGLFKDKYFFNLCLVLVKWAGPSRLAHGLALGLAGRLSPPVYVEGPVRASS